MRINVLGVGFDNVTMEQAVAEGVRLMNTDGAHYVVTPNPEIVETCREDSEAMEAVQKADLVIADGIGVVYGAKMLGTPLKGRVPGVEFAQHLMARMAESGKTLFLLGAKPVLQSWPPRSCRQPIPASSLLVPMTAILKMTHPCWRKSGKAGPMWSSCAWERPSRKSGCFIMAVIPVLTCWWGWAAAWMCSREPSSGRRRRSRSWALSGFIGCLKIPAGSDA